MRKLYVALLFAAGAAPLHAQPQAPAPATAVPIAPSVDSAQERQFLQKLTACLAQSRPRWARQTLSRPYLSDAQAYDAAQALKGTDTCLREPAAEVAFRTSGVVGSLAEYFLKADLAKTDFARVTEALYTLAPLNASEDFALCVAAGNPVAARDLALSEPGSAAEARASQTLAVHIAPCIRKGEDPTVDLQSLRALVSTALYRGVTAVGTRRS
jgi:hypothetical protein